MEKEKGFKILFKRPTTISETIYTQLKEAIVNGELSSNQRIQEKEVAELFQVSTTPVREAFQRLAAEKYIIINSRKDVMVASISLKEIKELFEVVRLLDAFASQKAVKRLTGKDIKELKELTKKLNLYYQQKKVQPYVKQNLKIHEKIWKTCGNKFLYDSLVNLGEKYTFYSNHVFFLTKNPHFFDRSYQDHIDLMEALEKRNSDRVKKILFFHWGKGFLEEDNTDSDDQ